MRSLLRHSNYYKKVLLLFCTTYKKVICQISIRKLLKEVKKLDKINKKINKHKVIERIGIKIIEQKYLMK